MNTYPILEANMERLQKKITRIQNKCRKYGCDFHYAEVGEEFRTVELEDGTKTTARFILVEAEGIAVINGWKFIASVEHTDKGNIINACCDIEVPERYYTTAPICEHCNSKRVRKNTFIVMNTETGEFKQVGHSCLNDFTHGMSAEGVAQYTSLFDELIQGEEPSGCGWGEKYYDTKELLTFAAEVVIKFGYIKADGYGRCTREQVMDYWNILHGGMPSMLKDYENQCKEEMEKVCFNPDSEQAKKLAEDALEWIAVQDESNNYIHNVKTVCSLNYVKAGNVGIMISILPTFNKELERLTKKELMLQKMKEEAELSKHIGSVGERIEFVPVEIKCLTSWETEYGITFIYKFTDAESNVYTWKTSKWIDEEQAGKITVKGTVKEHKEYKGVKQTEITRCKVA